jgi:hypothetical protein
MIIWGSQKSRWYAPRVGYYCYVYKVYKVYKVYEVYEVYEV